MKKQQRVGGRPDGWSVRIKHWREQIDESES